MAILDPAGHMHIAVSDMQISMQFYGGLFACLGYERKKEHVWVTPRGFGFWLIPAEHQEPRHRHGAPGLHHYCFPAESIKAVGEVYRLLHHLAGVTGCIGPQRYPQYESKGEMYYAIFFFDPDGIKLEVAYHQ